MNRHKLIAALMLGVATATLGPVACSGGDKAVVAGQGEVLGIGMVSHGRHSARGVIALPTNLTDLWNQLTQGRDRDRDATFNHAILHDVPLQQAQQGSALLDSSGRLIGINLHHPARGTTYAARLDEIFREFKLGKGI